MPKTRFQDIVFSCLMAFVMTYAMEVYNLSLNQGGLHNQIFIEVFQDVFFMALIVVLVEKCIAGRLARKCAARLMTPSVDKAIFVTLSMQFCTICFMSPIMSLIATLLFKHPGSEVIAVWLQTLAFNFPMAFFWQIFFAGPLVRFLFAKCFAKQLASALNQTSDELQVS